MGDAENEERVKILTSQIKRGRFCRKTTTGGDNSLAPPLTPSDIDLGAK
jgi:hypothetical protein